MPAPLWLCWPSLPDGGRVTGGSLQHRCYPPGFGGQVLLVLSELECWFGARCWGFSAGSDAQSPGGRGRPGLCR